MTTYYNDHDYIYDFPGGYLRKHHCHCNQQPRTTEVVETSKDVVISDINGQRYRVSLHSKQYENGLEFQVLVIDCRSSSPSPMHVYPGASEYYTDYKEAQQKFSDCVRQYDSLVKAETQDFDNIDVYASKIGYEVICPKCCLFCRWGCSRGGYCDTCTRRINCIELSSCNFKYNSWPMPQVPSVLRCTCPKNVKQFSFLSGMPHVDKCYYQTVYDSWQKLPWMDNCPLDEHADHNLVKIYPTVSPFGHCKSFEYANWAKPNAELSSST